ncbi:bifunctional Rieske [2Fe-2S] iron-sulfur domain/Rieske [2Fe-2S] iron-sulfur domain superfamily/Rieske-like [2Fe-2S] domain [Babesia duncani]|uniref:Bifunctional Rieske [2Fe-2S] iron-sulfur domain/Rieske [2Fe-2S] iron-sulfur domain superfamily/Rieske-like [2Fe-2S] domain n=1 Tax=Babesia duncani TaxID=323732 RepID=A0AAD9PLV2_9APIC|nr:bifunctional Rieske [2Fe-2S] iron-sulfur domain/Rieske [2Fe-2S] iron-sulfur domain superfamily/Rieske-like [2Fe-2S] domain [Babesia duncani]
MTEGVCCNLHVFVTLVAIFHHNDHFYAIDANCYHAAGRLEEATVDIEEILGEPCIRCPLHARVISLTTGHCMYQNVKVAKDDSNNTKITPIGWKSMGQVQRTHAIKILGNILYIKINKDEAQLESDQYCHLH